MVVPRVTGRNRPRTVGLRVALPAARGRPVGRRYTGLFPNGRLPITLRVGGTLRVVTGCGRVVVGRGWVVAGGCVERLFFLANFFADFD